MEVVNTYELSPQSKIQQCFPQFLIVREGQRKVPYSEI